MPIPDPLPVPDMKHSFSMYTMNFKQMNVYDLSKFRIVNMESELALMQVRFFPSLFRYIYIYMYVFDAKVVNMRTTCNTADNAAQCNRR